MHFFFVDFASLDLEAESSICVQGDIMHRICVRSVLKGEISEMHF